MIPNLLEIPALRAAYAAGLTPEALINALYDRIDAYPDKALFQASRGLVYSRNSPHDTNGGNYYARIEFRY
jgi:iron complex outermembrane receptor protein